MCVRVSCTSWGEIVKRQIVVSLSVSFVSWVLLRWCETGVRGSGDSRGEQTEKVPLFPFVSPFFLASSTVLQEAPLHLYPLPLPRLILPSPSSGPWPRDGCRCCRRRAVSRDPPTSGGLARRFPELGSRGGYDDMEGSSGPGLAVALCTGLALGMPPTEYAGVL